MNNKKQNTQKQKSAFRTYAALDVNKQYPNSKVHIPSINCVEDAKEWVDENEK